MGCSQVGKAPGFGPGMRGFESLHPSQIREKLREVAHTGGFWVGGAQRRYILPSRYTYGICYTDILHKISVVGYNQDASIIVF